MHIRTFIKISILLSALGGCASSKTLGAKDDDLVERLRDQIAKVVRERDEYRTQITAEQDKAAHLNVRLTETQAQLAATLDERDKLRKSLDATAALDEKRKESDSGKNTDKKTASRK